MAAPVPASADWPGKRLGLPETGRRSVARFGRRLAGIAVDWAIAYVVVVILFLPDPFGFKVLGVFAILQLAFLLVFNGSIGHLVVGVRLVPLNPGYLGYWRPVVRTVLLALFIPAVIYDRDQRGLHDRWAGTILVRR
jgi:uncharacterized RDD family membrane protein YckC